MGGRRKRERSIEVADAPIESSTDSKGDLQEAFRRHFEAQFEPLPNLESSALPEQSHKLDLEEDSDESDWDGISSGEESVNIEVVDHTTPVRAERSELPKEEAKEFMVDQVAPIQCLPSR